MAKTLMNKGAQHESDASDFSPKQRRIPAHESDAITTRIKEVVGDKKVVWFASECGVGESTLRNILSGAVPRTDILAAIADAGGVTIDWLATGRPPKTRAEQRALAAAARPAAGEADLLAADRAAAPAGRHALDQLAAALRTPSAPAWLAAGQAINAAAALSGKPETGQP